MLTYSWLWPQATLDRIKAFIEYTWFHLWGAYGKGEVYEQGYFIGLAKVKQFSFGFQLGVQSYSEFIFFKRKEALDDFTKGRFKFSAQMSAVVTAAGASTDANYSKNVAVFTMVKGGLMYDVSVGGQKFSFKHAKPEDRRSFTWRVAVGTGSGFFVSPGGHILTNQHVIDECNRIVVRTIERDMEAFAVLEDPENDLALLKTTNHYPSHIAEFRSGKEIRVGDEVIAFGYPLGDYLGDSVKVTVGTVSALTGPENDTKLYQITAPIQNR